MVTFPILIPTLALAAALALAFLPPAPVPARIAASRGGR